ncbi:hypothetical protein CPB85DRAFT_920253 [Mucidula mucida]|nr:hypothetical protein CPB85DRAFT_920253 [Mucidula mucida]
MLPTSAAWSFREVIEKKTSPPHPGARPMPLFAREGGTFLFQLVWAEQGAEQTADEDAWQYSQVWVADVTKVEEIEAVAQPERVVLKIFQPSMLPLPFPDTGYQYVPGPAYQLAFSEEVIYTHLRRLQGSHIPYFFGTFKIILPCGEEAYVLMLEYIDGETLDSWVTDFDGEKLAVLPAVIKSIPDAFREICEEKVLHTDMEKHLNNILIDKDGRAVIIDFVQNAIFDSAEQVKEEVLYRSGTKIRGAFAFALP